MAVAGLRFSSPPGSKCGPIWGARFRTRKRGRIPDAKLDPWLVSYCFPMQSGTGGPVLGPVSGLVLDPEFDTQSGSAFWPRNTEIEHRSCRIWALQLCCWRLAAVGIAPHVCQVCASLEAALPQPRKTKLESGPTRSASPLMCRKHNPEKSNCLIFVCASNTATHPTRTRVAHAQE